MSLPKVVIIELGSQYTLLIERSLRELGVRSVILEPKRAKQWFEKNPTDAVILSGGAASVYEKDAPQPPEEILAPRKGKPLAILGICYGMQWIAHRMGGKVEVVSKGREYGRSCIDLDGRTALLFNETPEIQDVWASHGDSVTHPPDGFVVIAKSFDIGGIAAIQRGSVYGVQFHPEVTHTQHGKKILDNFIRFSNIERDWEPSSIARLIQEGIIERVGDKSAMIGFSGGVDSTTLAAIAAPILGEQLTAVTIDAGHLREGELDEIREHAKAAGVSRHVVIDARDEFFLMMRDVIEAEEKRRRFKREYAATFRCSARGGISVVLQGTLAPDRIESGVTGGAVIKSHHNIGLDLGSLQQIHPIEHLFKYEVRELAKEIDLPKSVWNRQPFPGPGLFLRVVGVPATPDKLEIVRWADARVKEILVRHGVYDQISQTIVAYIGVPTVGVKGDGRVYKGAIAVRAIETSDFMTARGVHFSDEIEEEISSTLTTHPEVVRVWYDPTQKPPATTEFE